MNPSTSSSSSSSSSKNVPQKPSVNKQVINNDQTSVLSVVPDESKESLQKWLNSLYDVSSDDANFLNGMWDNFSYKGFNRDEVLKQLHSITKEDRRLAIEIIVATALRGPQSASQLKLSNGRTPKEMNIAASGGQGSKKLTLNKIQASTADLAAYYLKKMKAPKRLNVECPAWLQFPSAASITMPKELRDLHRSFSEKFSLQIGGNFQEQIYFQMEQNSYINADLHLFN